MAEIKKPTIAELEEILSRPHRGYFINPDGSINSCEGEVESLRSELAAVKAERDNEKRMKEIHRGKVQRAHQAYHQLTEQIHKPDDDTEPAELMRMLVAEFKAALATPKQSEKTTVPCSTCHMPGIPHQPGCPGLGPKPPAREGDDG